jgi:hypothetical protein
LGNERYLVLKPFYGQLKIHIRQYVRHPNGVAYPTKQGICLTPSHFAALIHCKDAVCREISKDGMNAAFKFHLGDGIFVSSSAGYPLIHIRRHFLPEGVMCDVPTKKGIALRMKEWYAIVRQLEGIKQRSTEIAQAVPCCDNHQNVESALACPECNPFGFPLMTLSSLVY